MSNTIFPMDIDRTNLDQVTGYSKALMELLKWLGAETNFDPAKRHIDSVTILDNIGAASKDITAALLQIGNDIPKNLFTQPQNTQP